MSCSCCRCHYQSDAPNKDSPGHIPDRSGQRIDVLGDCDSCDIEGGNGEDTQDAEE